VEEGAQVAALTSEWVLQRGGVVVHLEQQAAVRVREAVKARSTIRSDGQILRLQPCHPKEKR
jgi:hypothetical protein